MKQHRNSFPDAPLANKSHPGYSLDQIEASIREAAALLPRQGPITKFAFLNPLMGLEHEHFDEVMCKVGDVFGNEAYLDDNRYRQKLQRGRFTEEDLREVLLESLGTHANEAVGGLDARLTIRMAMLTYPLHFGLRRELDWVLAKTDALQHFRPEVAEETRNKLIEENRLWLLHRRDSPFLDCTAELPEWSNRNLENASQVVCEAIYLRSLWRVIRQGVEANQTQGDNADTVWRTRDSEIAAFRADTSDRRVDEIMIRFTAAYLDQGYAVHPLPHVASGYWASFLAVFSRNALLAPRWQRALGKELQRIEQEGSSPLAAIQASLERLKVLPAQVDGYLRATLLSLSGFAGMLWQTEVRPDLFVKPSPPGTLVAFVAVRLLLLSVAKEHACSRSQRPDEPETEVRRGSSSLPVDSEQLAFMLFELAQILGWTPEVMEKRNPIQWREICDELLAFSDHQRRKIFHAALERRIAKKALRAIGVRAALPPEKPTSPKLQVVCCIDAREESLRRHLEELDASVETYGIAGFFGVPMYYRGLGEAAFSALCPIVIKPQHWVTEEAVFSFEESNVTRARARRFVGTAQKRFHSESRGSIGGAIVSTLVGPLATIPMLSRILLPRLTSRMNRTARQFIAPPTVTRLHLERSPEYPAAPPSVSDVPQSETSSSVLNSEGMPQMAEEGIGFTLDEMARMAEKSLRDIGLTSRFAPLVLLLGHGSGCLNNPHESSYHCGACAGNPGGPNARALAAILNDVRVRRKLAANDVAIPDDSYFIGGQHNTATEEIMFFDLELLPTSKLKHVRAAQRLLAEAASRNAHERCRRFESAALNLTPGLALLHVQNRSEDLAQTRPEYGNGTNAICFVGRRERIRGLYLDRRAFMMSYDATQDTIDSSILARILAAVVPVCQGINLQYTLSAIDPSGWGAGTKLPHNITSLIGVMDGAASDLRPGLPWQGVDIHEPVRLLFIIETTPESLLRVMAGNQVIDRIFRNHWAHVATLNPTNGELHRFTKNQFVLHSPSSDPISGMVLPTADGSFSWYQGNRDHLDFAITTPQRRDAKETLACSVPHESTEIAKG